MDRERKLWRVLHLDPTDHMLLTDMWFCKEVKLFVFMKAAERTEKLQATVEQIAAEHMCKLRVYLGEPVQCGAVMEDFGLAVADAPVAVAQRTQPQEQMMKWRMPAHTAGHLDCKALIQFATQLASQH